MNMKRTLASIALAGTVALTAIPSAPALADGAASTRNIIGGAAVIGGTLLIINHNKQVHAKEDQMASAQAQSEESANNAQAAYESERRAGIGAEAGLRQRRTGTGTAGARRDGIVRLGNALTDAYACNLR